MKYALVVSLLFSGTNAFSALNLKPGLWTISTKVKTADGKEYDPQAKMREAMAKMSPEQKKKMEEMSAKFAQKFGRQSSRSPFKMGSKGMQLCITKEMLNDESIFMRQQKTHQDCETTFPTKTSNKVVSSFACKNGTTGTAEWNVKDSSHYNGVVKMTLKNGRTSTIKHEGTFTSSNCGDVAPFTAVGKEPPAKK